MNPFSRKSILLVEDNRDDEELTVLALRENRLLHDIFVVRDGVEALDFLLARGGYAQRNPRDLPQIVLLDLKLPAGKSAPPRICGNFPACCKPRTLSNAPTFDRSPTVK